MRKELLLGIIVSLFSLGSFAQVNKQAYGQLSLEELKDLPSGDALALFAPEGKIDNDSWRNYITDHCNEYDLSNHYERHQRQDDGLRRCKDGTVSYVQPASRGIQGWEGRCGQTAASNITYGLCNISLNPDTYINNYFRDISPGVYPSSMSGGLTELFEVYDSFCPQNKKWKWLYAKTQSAYIDSLRIALKGIGEHSQYQSRKVGSKTVKRIPVALLLRDPGSRYLHWVTLVDIEGYGKSCKMVVNHWNKQYKVPCETMSKWSKGVSDSYSLLFKAYNMIVMVGPKN